MAQEILLKEALLVASVKKNDKVMGSFLVPLKDKQWYEKMVRCNPLVQQTGRADTGLDHHKVVLGLKALDESTLVFNAGGIGQVNLIDDPCEFTIITPLGLAWSTANARLAAGVDDRASSKQKPVASTEYYKVLGVATDATQGEIKKAYYTLAMHYHPDKNTGLDEAEQEKHAETFKKIGEAYGCLSDPSKRSVYDKFGKDSQIAAFSENFDPEEYFKNEFGGDDFVPIIGQLEVASLFKDALKGMKDPQDLEQDKASSAGLARDKMREKRIEELSTRIVEKLSIFTEPVGDSGEDHGQLRKMSAPLTFKQLIDDLLSSALTTTDMSFSSTKNRSDSSLDLPKAEPLSLTTLKHFILIMRDQAQHLAKAPRGPDLLMCTGGVYLAKAESAIAALDSAEGNIGNRLLGFGMRISRSVRDKTYLVGEMFTVIKSFQELKNAKDQLDKLAAQAESDPEVAEKKRRLEQETAAKLNEALWKGTKLEIESVLREVADRILTEAEEPAIVHRKRAIALYTLGRIYQAVGKAAKKDTLRKS